MSKAEAADRLEQDFKDGIAATQAHKGKKAAAKRAVGNQASTPAKLKSKAR